MNGPLPYAPVDDPSRTPPGEGERVSGSERPKLPLDFHPLPWKLGESKMSSTEIVDANGRYVASVNKGGILLGHAGTPQMVVAFINAYGQIE